jgi:SAM-dependent methyltransferase
MSTKTLDLGCGLKPRNPFNADELFGIDIRPNENQNIKVADLAIEAIPFPDDHFDYVSAYDFIEHIPRVIYNPNRRFSFIELMNEIYRVLKMGGTFASFTPHFQRRRLSSTLLM